MFGQTFVQVVLSWGHIREELSYSRFFFSPDYEAQIPPVAIFPVWLSFQNMVYGPVMYMVQIQHTIKLLHTACYITIMYFFQSPGRYVVLRFHFINQIYHTDQRLQEHVFLTGKIHNSKTTYSFLSR